MNVRLLSFTRVQNPLVVCDILFEREEAREVKIIKKENTVNSDFMESDILKKSP